MEVERRDQNLAVVARPRVAGQVVEHLGHVGADLGVCREQAQVGVKARRLRVVIAGADMRVVADTVALATNDQDALRVALQRGQAVDDVHAGLLQLLRPPDVGLLVEARLQLHHADGLLAALGRLDQRRHQRGVGARPVHRLLDRQHVRVGHGLLDEALDRGGERVVGMMDEDVRFAGRREDVGLRAVLAEQPRLRDRAYEAGSATR